MRKLGIRSKILVLSVGLVAVASVLSAAASLLYTRSLIADYDEALKKEAAQQGRVYAQTASAFMSAADPNAVQALGILHGAVTAMETGQGSGSTLMYLDARLPDSSDPSGFKQVVKRQAGILTGFLGNEDRTRALMTRANESGRAVTEIDEKAHVFLAAFPIKVRGETFAVVEATLSAEEEFKFAADKKAEATRNGFIIAGAVMALVSGIGAGLAWWLSRGIVKPVKELTEIAEKVSMGELDVTVTRHSNDEIGELADSFSRMVTAVKFYAAAEDDAADVEERENVA